MLQQELLKHTVAALDSLAIDYMLTGSLASSVLGMPRATHDIDLVIHVEHTAITALLSHFQSPRFYFSEDAARSALATRGMFNVIDTASGDKVDFWIRGDDAFDVTAFSRRWTVQLADFAIKVPTPEDLVLF